MRSPDRTARRSGPVADDPAVGQVLEVCRYVDAHPGERHALKALAQRVRLSAFQLHRLFKAYLGISPREYVEQSRIQRLKRDLRREASATAAIYSAGYESSSVVYGRLLVQLGMTPRSYRSGGVSESISFAFGVTVLGQVLIGATDRGICYLQFGNTQGELLQQLVDEYPHAQIQPLPAESGPAFASWMCALNEHLQGRRRQLQLPLDIQGTAFQKRVWKFLCGIPRGAVVSYSDVARGIGAPASVRAAASACARNRIGVLIPCHRVLRGTGELGGYRWGLARKQQLLEIEGQDQ